ncbi:hypothetical protein [Bradyrhizobium macuxiense]|uniref:hypothetical protein n=1 Tax=Bradyrhizobium macuxiense TaxID=1755647 RepID=UPI0010A94FF9|nr:hypothetical protein [Bradyrhizobium macuxiense]
MHFPEFEEIRPANDRLPRNEAQSRAQLLRWRHTALGPVAHRLAKARRIDGDEVVAEMDRFIKQRLKAARRNRSISLSHSKVQAILSV